MLLPFSDLLGANQGILNVGSITVPLTSCLTGLESAVWQLTFFCVYLPNRLIQTSQTRGQWYSDTCPFSIPWTNTLAYSSTTKKTYDVECRIYPTMTRSCTSDLAGAQPGSYHKVFSKPWGRSEKTRCASPPWPLRPDQEKQVFLPLVTPYDLGQIRKIRCVCPWQPLMA
jgi:hypothetical protein